MDDTLEISSSIKIPRSEFRIQFVRSPGPGGQNVNKVNTKAVVHWAVYQSPSLHEAVKHRLMLAEKNRINNDGELVISSHQHRSQQKNLDDCLDRIRQMVLVALKPPRKRKPTRVTAGAKRRRLAAKREHSEKKKRRSNRNWERE